VAAKRVVTGINDQGHSYIASDGPNPSAPLDMRRVILQEIWLDVPGDASPNVATHPSDPLALIPPTGGSVFRVIRYQPPNRANPIDDETLAINRQRWDAGASHDPNDKANQGWHTTPTIDYGYIISGQIELRVDEGVSVLSAGDTFVQRATRHAWRVTGDEECVIAFVLIANENSQQALASGSRPAQPRTPG
jgi:hypothetical protein